MCSSSLSASWIEGIITVPNQVKLTFFLVITGIWYRDGKLLTLCHYFIQTEWLYQNKGLILTKFEPDMPSQSLDAHIEFLKPSVTSATPTVDSYSLFRTDTVLLGLSPTTDLLWWVWLLFFLIQALFYASWKSWENSVSGDSMKHVDISRWQSHWLLLLSHLPTSLFSLLFPGVVRFWGSPKCSSHDLLLQNYYSLNVCFPKLPSYFGILIPQEDGIRR